MDIVVTAAAALAAATCSAACAPGSVWATGLPSGPLHQIVGPEQFLTPHKPGRRNPRKKARDITTALDQLGSELAGDHRGHMAVADLHCTAGLVHPRLTEALTYGPNGLKEPLVHVGLHLREQRGQRRGPATEPPRLMWTLVALVPQDGGLWQTLAYLRDEDSPGGTWLDYATANTLHRARRLPDGRRRDAQLPRSIDRALFDLGDHAGTDTGYIVYVSGDQARSIWPLLANRHLGRIPELDGTLDERPALPGFTLPTDQRPRAVLRVTAGSEHVASPALVERLNYTDEASPKTQEAKLATGVFLMEGTTSTFILCNLPQQYTGSSRHARAGEKYTRWASTSAEEQAETWYSHTATEISVDEQLPPSDCTASPPHWSSSSAATVRNASPTAWMTPHSPILRALPTTAMSLG
ncbi:RNaseH domain-containing protein [Streptomyces sp. NPDC005134]